MIDNEAMDMLLENGYPVFCNVRDNSDRVVKCKIVGKIEGEYITLGGETVANPVMADYETKRYFIFDNGMYLMITPFQADIAFEHAGEKCLFSNCANSKCFLTEEILNEEVLSENGVCFSSLNIETGVVRYWPYMAVRLFDIEAKKYTIQFTDKNGKCTFSARLTKNEWLEVYNRLEKSILNMR